MSDPDALAPLVGLWGLDPAHSDSAEGQSAKRAVYTILAGSQGLSIHARWTDPDDQTHQVAFLAIPDGRRHPLPGGDGWMESALDGGELIVRMGGDDGEHYRLRHSRDGERLVVREESLGEHGWESSRTAYRPTAAKQVLLYRRDLKMRKGKIAAQCAHASMAVFFRRNHGDPGELRIPLDGPMAVWSAGRFAKIVLSVEDEPALLRAHAEAVRTGLPAALITDSGKTEFGGVPTRTAVALGPAATDEIDRISGPDGLVATRLA
ncbi:peptidyl-tRNA hydrolase [Haliangium sp.]|uniref:peptidyl-tRNA hydrolase n=1 Tax=Haliangium sp. TaxID=2663208 RepID=UPI003D12F489